MYRELTGRRNGVEAANNSLKRNLLNGRARSIGRNAQHADLVLAALFNNKMAEMRHAAYSELELAA